MRDARNGPLPLPALPPHLAQLADARAILLVRDEHALLDVLVPRLAHALRDDGRKDVPHADADKDGLGAVDGQGRVGRQELRDGDALRVAHVPPLGRRLLQQREKVDVRPAQERRDLLRGRRRARGLGRRAAAERDGVHSGSGPRRAD